MAGLYTLDQGAHNYWLEKIPPDKSTGKVSVKGREDGIITLLHYDDTANAAMTAVFQKKMENDISKKFFLVSDGHPTTRKGICESALKASQYREKTMPIFLGGSGDDLGKVYDGSWTNDVLQWQPVFAKSFDLFMSSNGE